MQFLFRPFEFNNGVVVLIIFNTQFVENVCYPQPQYFQLNQKFIYIHMYVKICSELLHHCFDFHSQLYIFMFSKKKKNVFNSLSMYINTFSLSYFCYL